MMRNLLSTIVFVLFFVGAGYAQSVLLETELFDNKGGWTVDAQFIDQMGSPYLLAHGLGTPVEDAVTKFKLPQKGKYQVWVRTKDWAPFPKGPGEFQLLFNGEILPVTFGASGQKGWQWVSGGTVDFKNVENELSLRDLTGFEGRCDAVYLSKVREVLPDSVEALRWFRKNKLQISQKNGGHFDLVVVGGGVAGICASVQAARLGLKVALINNRPVLGGNSSSEVRVGMEGDVFSNKYPKLGRIVREIDNFFAGVGGVDTRLYNDVTRKKMVLNEQNITLFENAHLIDVKTDNYTIKSVVLLDVNTLNEIKISGNLFSDCTGDATLGILAGADYHYGRESKAETNEPDASDVSDNLVMGSSNQWHAKHTNKETDFPIQEWMHQFSDDYHFDLIRSVWNWETGFNSFHTVRDAEEIRDNNFRAIYGNWAYLKTHKKEKFGKYSLTYLSYVAGKRESFRLLGDILLTQNDITQRVEYPDAVVTATWGIDLHYPDKENARRFPNQEFIAYAVHPLREVDVYTFPYRCLYSRNINNLFMAGRNISVTHIALGTVRVQRCTGMMGEVVGYAAYLCRKYACLPKEVYSKYLGEFTNILKAEEDYR